MNKVKTYFLLNAEGDILLAPQDAIIAISTDKQKLIDYVLSWGTIYDEEDNVFYYQSDRDADEDDYTSWFIAEQVIVILE